MFTPKDYLSWLDSEIKQADKFYKIQETLPEAEYWKGAAAALESAKSEFLTIQFPSQLTEEETEDKSSNFTDNLD